MTADQPGYSAAGGDMLNRFLIETADVRGAILSLDQSYCRILDNDTYPAEVASLLGQALTASVLLTSGLKIDGSIIMQVQGSGPLHTLVAQARADRSIRGLAKWREPVRDLPLTELVGDRARLTMTLDNTSGEGTRYQGIVEVTGDALAETVESYFTNSEQLSTRLWLFADHRSARGLLIQKLPDSDLEEEWRRIEHLTSTLTREELMGLTPADVLRRLYHEEDLRLYRDEPVRFYCGCSRERIDRVLRALGEDEVNAIVEERGEVAVDCEFCGRGYLYETGDIMALFRDVTAMPSSDTIH